MGGGQYLVGCVSHWMPQVVNIQRDIKLWKKPDGLIEDERPIFERNLVIFVTADLLAASNIGLGSYHHITMPKCCQYLLGWAFKEVIHTQTYEVHRGIAGLDEKEIFSACTRWSRRSATRAIP